MPEYNIPMSIREALAVEGYTEFNIPNQIGEEKNMPIYHFINEFRTGETTVTMRTITTEFMGKEGIAYHESAAAKRPIEGIFRIDSGNWLPTLLIERLANRGISFRLTIVSNRDLAEMGNVISKVNNCNMVWSNASYSFFLKIHGQDTWGLEALGLTVDFARKTSKRMQEVARFTSMWNYSEDGSRFLFTRTEDLDIVNSMVHDADFVIAEFETPAGMDEKLFDGMNYCTRRFALAMCRNNRKMARKILDGKAVRFNVRGLCKMGVIKGDMIIVPDSDQLGGADFVYHTENLKPELRTNGWVSFSASEHAAVHTAGIDVQSKINNPSVISYRKEVQDIKLYEDEMIRVITEGEFPASMLIPERAHNEDTGGIELGMLTELLHRDVIRWQAAGLDLRDSQNFMFMALNGGIRRMDNGIKMVGSQRLYKKTYTPMSQAINAGIVTHSSMKLMGGFNMEDTGETEFVMGIGMVLDDQRFLSTFDLHGTWDLDDTSDFIRVKIWSGNPAKTAALIHDGVLPTTREIPTNESEAIEAVVVIRSPNGPGEYAIEFMSDEDVPWQGVSGEVPVINLVDLPRGQGRLLSKVTKQGLPESQIVFGGEMTRAQAVYMVEAQITNPGIGMLANAMMCWVNVMGVSFPPVMTDVFGEMVDAVQQGFDKEQLAAVAAESDLVFAQLVEAMAANPNLKLDRELALTRAIPAKYMEQIRKEQIVAGRITHTNALYQQTRNKLGEFVTNTTLVTRNNGHLAEVVRGVMVGKEVGEWASAFVSIFEANLKSFDQQFIIKPSDNAFKKMLLQHYKTAEYKRLVGQMVQAIRDTPDPDRYVIGLYKWMLVPKANRKYGSHDRIIFQGGEDESVMDLLIVALRNRGLI